jgi:hypothetical protein
LAFVLTKDAQAEMLRRGIPEDLVARVLNVPDQVVSERAGLMAYQSRVELSANRVMLVRVIVDDRTEPHRVITVYRTSKIQKYWRQA